ncbi:hypothetical protein JCM10207_004973 [Rhodosporidiobolus poonsookiae]
MSSTAPPHWFYVVNASVSALSVCGGLAIVVGYALSAQRSALRQKLVLGLGVTDLLQACVTLAGNGRELAGERYEPDSSGCLASGFLYQTCVISNACWTLTIALTTYITLVHPFSTPTTLLEHRFAFPCIALVVAIFGIVPSIATTVSFEIVDYGGVCWLPIGTISANLLLFIPRATVLVIVIGLYLRLFLFFRMRDINVFDTTTDEESQDKRGKRLSFASIRLPTWSNRRSSETRRPSSAMPGHEVGQLSPPPLSPIPGSPVTPAVAFTTPFGDSSHMSTQHHSVSVSLPPSHESPTNSTTSTPYPDAPTSPTAPQSKRHSSVAFPARFSVVGERRESEGKRRRALTPRQVNKRLSLLMLVYPAAYSVLVAVAMVRLIQSFARGNAPATKELRWISGWLIYAQGLVDGLLFVLVSLVFKRWARRD